MNRLDAKPPWAEFRKIDDKIHLYLPKDVKTVRGVFACFVWTERHVDAAQYDGGALLAEMRGPGVGPQCRAGEAGYRDKIERFVLGHGLDALVDQRDRDAVVAWGQCRQGGERQRRFAERDADRPELEPVNVGIGHEQ